MSKLKFQTNMSTYEGKDFWEIHAIQLVHIEDYIRIKEQVETLQFVGGRDEAVQREIAELSKLKDKIYVVISDFGVLLDSIDGTRRI